MMSFCNRVIPALLCAALCAGPAQATHYFYGAVDPVIVKQTRLLESTDYMEMFNPNAPWRAGASRLFVFEVSTQFVLGAPDADIRTVFADMRLRHVRMMVSIGTVIRLDSCGMGEGYAPPDLADRVGRRLQSLGVTLDYMSADEPVWFAHEKNWGRAPGGAPNCEYPLPVVAQRVTMSFNAMRRHFPAIQLGDIEVVANDRTPPARLIADYVEFARLFQAQSGEKLAFFHADIAWHSGWQPMIAPLARAMHANGIPFGMVIGGSPEHTTDEEWVQAGLQRLRALEANPATRPDDVFIASWQRLPSRNLPETQPGTGTFLLREAEAIGGP